MKPLDTPFNAQAAALSPSSYHDFAGLQSLKGKAKDDGNSETALRAAAQQFEAMFLHEMMRTMRQATIKSDLMESNAMETFEGMFDKEVSMQMAKKGGMGLADSLVKQMSQRLQAEQAMATLGAQEVLQSRERAGLPLVKPSNAHELNPVKTAPTLPLPAARAYDLKPRGTPAEATPPAERAAD